jgi:hypothetical protein
MDSKSNMNNLRVKETKQMFPKNSKTNKIADNSQKTKMIGRSLDLASPLSHDCKQVFISNKPFLLVVDILFRNYYKNDDICFYAFHNLFLVRIPLNIHTNTVLVLSHHNSSFIVRYLVH